MKRCLVMKTNDEFICFPYRAIEQARAFRKGNAKWKGRRISDIIQAYPEYIDCKVHKFHEWRN